MIEKAKEMGAGALCFEGNMANEHFTSEQVRLYMKDMLPKLNYWKQYKNLDGADKFEDFNKRVYDFLKG